MPTEALTTKAIEFGAIHAYQFDEASGDLLDFVGSNDGTISGTPDRELSDGYGNGASAYGFDGSTDYITLGSNILNGASAYTIEAVIKKPAVAASEIVFSERDGASDGPALFLDASERFTFRHNATSITGSPIAADEVVHVQGTWDGSTLRLYVNGELQASDSDATAVSTTTVGRIGCRSTAVSLLLTGDIAHLAIYDSALSQAQINELVLTARPPLLRYQLDLSASAADSALTDYATRVGTASISTAQNTAIMSTDTGNGADVWFSSDEAGTLPIDAKLVYWDDATSKFAFDVEITSVSAVSGATIYLQVGSKPGGYGDDPYRAAMDGVYEQASDFNDLTSNSNNGTTSGGVTAGGVTGPDGHTPATDYDGVDDRVTLPNIENTVNGAAWSFSVWSNADAYQNHNALRSSGGASSFSLSSNDNSSFAGSRSNINDADGYGDTLKDDAGDRSGDGWIHTAATYDGTDFKLFVDGVEEDSSTLGAINMASTAFRISDPTFFWDGQIGRVSAYSEAISAAEINADYLLQGSTASSYWTVTDVTPGLPAATFDLRSDREVVRSGSDVTSWGNASGGTSPTYSDDPADKVLGFPAIQFDQSSSQYLEWDEIASMFSGDDPDWTAAILFRPATESGAKAVLGVDSDVVGADSDILRVTGTPTIITNRDDATNGPSITLASSPVYGTSYLALIKSEGGTVSGLVYDVDAGSDLDNDSSDFSSAGSITMVRGGIGCVPRPSPTNFYEGSIHRIRLYNTALGGDLTGDLTGTQLGALKDEMLLQAARDRTRTRRRGRRRYW